MGTVYTFTSRPRRAAGVDARAAIEEAAQAALDTADRLIALLDQMDGNPDDEDDGDAEPSLGAPENHVSQVVWLRGSDLDHEQDSTP